MADDRRIFPTETVLELVTGKKGADVREIATYITGQPVTCANCAQAAAPFAAAWLARWYPKFMDMDLKDDWNTFVASAKSRLGDNISITPMTGQLKKLTGDVLDHIKETRESLLRQTDAAVKLEQKVRELEPLDSALKALQKKNNELEEKLKSAKTEMGALQRKVNEFQGKLPIDNSELMQTIKSAIKDGLKGMAVAAPSAQASSDAEPQAKQAAPVSEEDEWDARPNSNDDDEWG